MKYKEKVLDVPLLAQANSHGKGGDSFVQKSPAATIGQLAKILRKIFDGENEIVSIGTRHGEKKHECLLSREEMVRSENLGEYYRINPDGRDLNYGLYVEEGEEKISTVEDYTSANTQRLSDEELETLLRELDYVQRELETAAINFGGHE